MESKIQIKYTNKFKFKQKNLKKNIVHNLLEIMIRQSQQYIYIISIQIPVDWTGLII